MCPLFESIKLVNGEFINLDLHQQRVDRSRREILGNNNRLNLMEILQVPEQYSTGIVKCRVSYGEDAGPVIFSKYVRKVIDSIQLVSCPRFDYSYKYEDRSKIDGLLQQAAGCDEILISCEGLVTDTSYSNIVLYDGVDWYTPARPLLEGTQRAKLLAEGVIEKADIHVSELVDFQKLVLINAMLGFEPEHYIAINNIKL